MTTELDPLRAPTAPHPYGYYADLARTSPFAYNPKIELWVAASAAVVREVLTHPSSRVRPPDAAIPPALRQTPLGDLFGRLVRMRDGAQHCPLKQAVTATLATLAGAQVAEVAHHWAKRLAHHYNLAETAEQVGRYITDMPLYVVGSMLGLPDEALALLPALVPPLVAGLAPTGTPEQIGRGAQAAEHLASLVRHHLHATSERAGALFTLARSGAADEPTLIANGIGLFIQTYEATAGLIGNSLLTLINNADACDRVLLEPPLLHNLVAETLRADPPIHNTRRFLAEAGAIAGQTLPAGAPILVVLAAANYDALANPDPLCFDLWRTQRQIFTFGIGDHACPGADLAVAVAVASITQLLATGVWRDLPTPIRYRSITNARIPLFPGQA